MPTYTGTNGNDRLEGDNRDDDFYGLGGNDVILGRGGDDSASVNIDTDGQDKINLGAGRDVVQVSRSGGNGQVRLDFTSAEVGNGRSADAGINDNQDGGLAVRMQGENSSGEDVGNESRFDDEGITFVADVGVTFDVRDLVFGTERGDYFQWVTLGTAAGDVFALPADKAAYVNGGQGNDSVTTGNNSDFLVGGAGDDLLYGRGGADKFLGGAGNDYIHGGAGVDRMEGGAGDDTYVIDNPFDEVIEDGNAGYDTIRSSISHEMRDSDVERLILIGSADINARGSNAGDVIYGNAGDNIIVGGNGADVLHGGAGVDRFDFNDRSETVAENYDRIRDLEAQDIIDLSGIDADTGLDGNQAFVLVDAFTGNEAQLIVLYNAAGNYTMWLGDVTGDGVADIKIAALGDHRGFDNLVL